MKLVESTGDEYRDDTGRTAADWRARADEYWALADGARQESNAASRAVVDACESARECEARARRCEAEAARVGREPRSGAAG